MPFKDRDRLLLSIRSQFEEMPHLRLTAAQAGRLFGLPASVCTSVLATLLDQRVLWRSLDGRYALRDS
jgi:DNA-binding IclR family transcriptional regulator